jgi:hypothetical protein
MHFDLFDEFAKTWADKSDLRRNKSKQFWSSKMQSLQTRLYERGHQSNHLIYIDVTW